MAEKKKAASGAKKTAAKKPSAGKKKAPAKKTAKAKDAEGDAPAAESVEVPTPRFKTLYEEQIRGALKEKFGYTNDHAVPKLTKIVISMGVGQALANPKRLEEAQKHLSDIAGQKAVVTRARSSVSNFRLREGQAIGCKVTLRQARMYEFLDRLVSVAMPRIRDFRGMNAKSFDGRGNYSMGLSEQTVFTEVDADRMEFTQGMNIAICTTANTNEEARELITGFGFPFKKD
jgi:large subunit ribosomal protein L5